MGFELGTEEVSGAPGVGEEMLDGGDPLEATSLFG